MEVDLEFIIRRCQIGDENALSLLGKATFLETYAGSAGAADILTYAETEHTSESYRHWLVSSVVHIWVSEVPVVSIKPKPTSLFMKTAAVRGLSTSASSAASAKNFNKSILSHEISHFEGLIVRNELTQFAFLSSFGSHSSSCFRRRYQTGEKNGTEPTVPFEGKTAQFDIHLQTMGPSYQTTTISKTVTETAMVKLFARSPTYTSLQVRAQNGPGGAAEKSPHSGAPRSDDEKTQPLAGGSLKLLPRLGSQLRSLLLQLVQSIFNV
jgi:hypothetical protein